MSSLRIFGEHFNPKILAGERSGTFRDSALHQTMVPTPLLSSSPRQELARMPSPSLTPLQGPARGFGPPTIPQGLTRGLDPIPYQPQGLTRGFGPSPTPDPRMAPGFGSSAAPGLPGVEAPLLTRDQRLPHAQGPGVHLWGITAFPDLLAPTTRATLAAILSSFLNRPQGGLLFLGVKRSRKVLGVPLAMEQRERVVGVVALVASQLIAPPARLLGGSNPLVS